MIVFKQNRNFTYILNEINNFYISQEPESGDGNKEYYIYTNHTSLGKYKNLKQAENIIENLKLNFLNNKKYYLMPK